MRYLRTMKMFKHEKMRISLLTLTILSLASSLFAQEAADKTVQAGLVTGLGMNFQRMETKKLESGGVGLDLTLGANVNFALTETIGFNTGIEFDFETLKYEATGDQNVYYHYNDNKILNKNESSNPGSELYMMTTRTQKPVYLSIPTMFLFRTKFIGYFRYFGKFGMRSSFLLSNKINDEGFNHEPDAVLGLQTAGSNENMSAGGEMFFIKSSLGLAGGAEWNFTGSTTLMAELGFYYGFTPLYLDRDESKQNLYTSGLNNGTGNDDYFSNQVKQSQLRLKISILF